MGLINRFHQIDIDGRGSVEKQDVVKAVQDQGEATYDQARETLKEVNLDSSGRVELDDYVDVRHTGLATYTTKNSSTDQLTSSLIPSPALCQTPSRSQRNSRISHKGQSHSQG